MNKGGQESLLALLDANEGCGLLFRRLCAQHQPARVWVGRPAERKGEEATQIRAPHTTGRLVGEVVFTTQAPTPGVGGDGPHQQCRDKQDENE